MTARRHFIIGGRERKKSNFTTAFRQLLSKGASEMIVTINYEKQLREAYIAGAVAALLHDQKKGPKPDPDAYVRERGKSSKPIVKF